MLLTSDHEVLCLNPAGGKIQRMTTALHCTEAFIMTLLFSRYDLNNVERDVKHQTIFLFFHDNVCCGYSLEAPQRGASKEYPQDIFS